MPPLGKSHHSILFFEIEYNIYNQPKPERFLYDKGDYENMSIYINDEIKKVDFENTSANEAWNLLVNVMMNGMNKYIPKKKANNINVLPRKSNVSNSTLKKIKTKRVFFDEYKKFPTKSNYNLYAKARNQVKWEVRKEMKNKEKNLAHEAKTNPKKFYQYVALRTKPKVPVGNLINGEGKLTQNDQERAETLNSFFVSVFVQEPEGDIPNLKENKDIPVLNNIEISEDSILKTLRNLNVSKSPGPDLIHPRVLKELSQVLSGPFKIIFDKCLNEGKIPEAWKHAEVRPIFKKGDKSSPGNYRPVSLTSVPCKIFESFLRDALNQHLCNNSLLSEKQYGFTAGRSCIPQLLTTVRDWMEKLDNGESVDAIYLDLKKAFDTVPHKRLISKLSNYNVKGKVLELVKDFLSSRTQYVAINNSKSRTAQVTSGVPQGSVLGPTLFTYYINDMPDTVKNSVKIFADDTKAYSSIANEADRQALQDDIDHLCAWSEKWLLSFNSQKCKVLHLGKNNPKFNYKINDNDLEVTLEEKDLGVIMDPNLSFEKHIVEKIKKANSIAGLISRTINFKTKEIMILLFKALVRPIIEYGNVVWSPYLRKYIDQIEDVQRRFTKKIIGLTDMNYGERLVQLKLPSLEYRRLRGDLIEVYKILHSMYDVCTVSKLLSLVPKSDPIRTRNHGLKLEKKRVNSRLFLNFFSNRVVNKWNA